MRTKYIGFFIVFLVVIVLIGWLTQNSFSFLKSTKLNINSFGTLDKSEMNSEKQIAQTGWTQAVPQNYLQPAQNQGKIEKFDYESQDYLRDSAPITKTAYVYTPYGYNENNQYNILYLMHGWGGFAGDYFSFSEIKNLFDNLIENGDIPPLIIVAPTFYNENSEYDFSNSVAEFRKFHQDFENHLMPSVESQYSTYANSTSPEDLIASRDHRAFGGFSLGSVTTWLEFCHDADYIRYFLPMSGSSWYYGGFGNFQTGKNVDFIENLVNEKNLNDRGYFIFHTTGTDDAVKEQSLMQADEMLNRSDFFTPDHYVFYQKQGGQHDFNAVQEYLYNALPLFFKSEDSQEKQVNNYYSKDSTITSVINDPDFSNYGRLIFPVRSNYYSGNTLGDLNLVWYSNIDPDKTVEIVNYMKNKAQNNEPLFFDIYTEEEKIKDPSKRDTGLFFFKGNPGEKFAIINAGGGFAYVGAMQDSFPQALELSKKGYNAFALIYRPGWDTAMEDLARAISFVYANAEALEVNPNDYSLWGGSAGARMAATLGSYGPGAFGGFNLPQPATVVTQYSGHNNYTANDPPTYANVGTNDWIANWRTMQRRLQEMSAVGIPTEFHVYNGLSHGFGLGTGTEAEGWIDEAVSFWEDQVK